MVKLELIDLINSRETWAFIGNGCSIDSGQHSWEKLLENSLRVCEERFGKLPETHSSSISKFISEIKIPDAFSILKSLYGSRIIDEIVCDIINIKSTTPGKITKLLAKWPFKAYVTSNYDNLVEKALESFGGWVAVGNTAIENSKISSDVGKVVWHPHGGSQLGSKNSRLVIASSDYDEIYPAGSPTLNALESLCRMKRLVFIGFGFRDKDLLWTLEKISRLTTPSNPSYGFLANCSQRDREEYWEKYKIEIIPYNATENDHSDLLKILNAYSSFVLERSARYGAQIVKPEYDLETVGLMVHNRLIRSNWCPQKCATDCMLRGYIFAQLTQNKNRTREQLIDSLPHKSEILLLAFNEVLDNLLKENALRENSNIINLSEKGIEISQEGKAEYELARDQFQQSIENRARESFSDISIISNIRDVTIRYLERTCKERGLGIAQQLTENGDLTNRNRIVALMRDAKKELEAATNRDTAMEIIHCIWSVLSSPRLEEKRYLGLLTQAYFGRQLLSADPAATGVQLANLSVTVFIADSSFLIPLMALGSLGHNYADELYSRLRALNCPITTSLLLLDETVEHARYAWKKLNEHGSTSSQIIDIIRGAHGYKPNEFINGYLLHDNFGPGVPFKKYFANIFHSDGSIPNNKMVENYLHNKGIVVQSFNQWEGFDPVLYVERDNVQREIEKRRRQNITFTNDRQVMAEAEVAIIITKIRKSELNLAKTSIREAFFLSNSRVVDGLLDHAQRVCITPESLFEWIISIGEITENDANAIYDQLIREITKSGILIVPREPLLILFHNTIEASKSRLEELIVEHREIIREQYAISPDKAFKDLDPLAVPALNLEMQKKALNRMEEQLKEERRLRIETQNEVKIDTKILREYEQLKIDKKLRQEKAKHKKRALMSSPKHNRKLKRKKSKH